jgi:hypothetical protein
MSNKATLSDMIKGFRIQQEQWKEAEFVLSVDELIDLIYRSKEANPLELANAADSLKAVKAAS